MPATIFESVDHLKAHLDNEFDDMKIYATWFPGVFSSKL